MSGGMLGVRPGLLLLSYGVWGTMEMMAGDAWEPESQVHMEF